ncbi:MAG: transposase [Bacteroidetes bacterium]|nr:transposase [Bacteroidota bacterium]
MSEKYKASEPDSPYFITFTIVEWIHLFDIEEFASIIVESLKYCISYKSLSIYGYCIMPSHVHLIVQSHVNPLGNVIRDLKKYTSTQITDVVKREERYGPQLRIMQYEASKIKRNKFFKVWQDGFHPILLFNNKIFIQKLNYIHKNPVKAGLVRVPEEYYYSSVRNYAGLEAPLEIVVESRELSRV